MDNYIVRLRECGSCIGSGVLYYDESLGNETYVITAAHCLYKEPEQFREVRQYISVDIVNPADGAFRTIDVAVNAGNAVYGTGRDCDYAVLVLDRAKVENILGTLPRVSVIPAGAGAVDFISMGYPAATGHNTLHTMHAKWNAMLPHSRQFTLSTCDDITADYVRGYSGGGLFAVVGGEMFLAGIFSRFLPEERGRMIYGVGIDGLNALLVAARRRPVRIGPAVPGGVTEASLRRHLEDSVLNLGPNISRDFNVPVESMHAMEAIGNHPAFIARLKDALERWCTRYVPDSCASGDPLIARARNRFIDARAEVARLVASCPYGVDSPINIAEIHRILASAVEDIKKIKSAFPLEESYKCYSLIARCDELSDELDRCYAALSAPRSLLILGEAGCGKSHLMGSVARECLASGVPGMLFHGRDFDFHRSIEDNMLSMLGASCPFEALMGALDSFACRSGRRVLLLVDALNETERMEYWRYRLPAFVEKMEKYRGIGLAVTVRTTYVRDTLPEGYDGEGSPFYVHTHRGFAGSEQQAVEAFCRYYGLESPRFPVLNPEFSNPLFLHVACQVACGIASGSMFPDDMCLDRIFQEYPHILDRRFDMLRGGEYRGMKVASSAIRIIAEHMFNHSVDRIEYRECRRLLESAMGGFSFLLADLISDCLLSKSHDVRNPHEEYVRFTYQRLADYYQAERMVEGCCDAGSVRARFADEAFLKLLSENRSCDGIIEQLAIILPERFGLEFWEVLPDDSRFRIWNRSRTFMDSLLWRSAAGIDEDKCIAFLESEEDTDYYGWLETMLRLATVAGHPFNADHFHGIMTKFPSMASRDAVLQDFFLNRYDPAPASDSAVRRLIDWAWIPGISRETDKETARLGAMAIIWFLTATDMALRDRATKALVNLLQNQTDALLSVMSVAVGIDDVYLRERMYAVAYGCALRNAQPSDVERIARFVYEVFFSGGVGETHLLMRDYAACTVDYAHSLGLLRDVEPARVHPPYGASMPVLPHADTAGNHTLPNNGTVPHARAHNAIFYSMVEGLADFGHKIVEPQVETFSPQSFVMEKELNALRRSLGPRRREELDHYIEFKRITDKLAKLSSRTQSQQMLFDMVTPLLPDLHERVLKSVGADTLERVERELAPNHFKSGKSRYDTPFDHIGVRYWIVDRVFELGYDRELHGEFDETVMSDYYSHRHPEGHGGRIERIGKKYQRIAFMEILGRLADNYPLREWDGRCRIYEGPWVRFYRDCDPASVVRVSQEGASSWQAYELNPEWELTPAEWLDSIPSAADVCNAIERRDSDGRLWLTVYDYKTMHESHTDGRARGFGYRRMMNFQIRAHIVKKKDKDAVVALLRKKNLWKEAPEWPTDYSHAFLREKYWSRCAKYEKKETSDKWEPVCKGARLKCRRLLETIGGNMEDDCSGTGRHGYMPTRYLMDVLPMTWADDDMSFLDGEGRMVFTGDPLRSEHTLMAADALLAALGAAGLDIVWTVYAEKFYSPEERGRFDRVPVPSGVFYYDEDRAFCGCMKMYYR